MKRICTLLLAVAAMFVTPELKAVDFAYEAGAELVSSYLWRGQYNGGLSFQPEGLVGFDANDEAIQFRAGVWASVGASDWKFKTNGKDVPGDFNTCFMPEVDFIASFTAYGASVGFNEYYYCDDGSTHTSEIWAGYSFEHFFGHNAYINWYTTIAGADLIAAPTASDPNNERRAFSSYLEIGYDYTFEKIGLTLGAQIGMSPWESPLYGNDKFAVTNLQLKLDKEFDLDVCTLNIFAVGSLNPDNLVTDKSDPDYNVFVNAAGEDKLYMQKLNGCIGLGVWF